MAEATYTKYWTQRAIDRYFTSEAMSKTREAFNEVHVPIDRIRVDPSYPTARGRKEISETKLLEIVTASRPDQPNRIFLVVGDTGCGKSELCQWLHYNIHDEVHVPILIERRMIRLGEIVEEIHQHLDEPTPSDMIEITDLWPETVSAKLRAAVLMHLQRSQVQNALGVANIERLREILDTPEFERRMRTHFVRYRDELKRLDKPRQLQLLPEQDFRELAVQAGGLRNSDRCYSQVQRAMVDCLASELQVEDLIKKLGRISKGYRRAGKRPVLLIEDITTFGFLQNDLLDYMYNLAGGNFDVVMGVTTGFETENKAQIYKTQQTITERIEGRFELTDQRNETLFLRDHYLDLAQLYLAAISDTRDEACSQDAAREQAFDRDLYPFNQPFLTKIYRGLHQDQNRKQTPRLYLRAIQSVLESDNLPHQAIELSPNVSEPGTFFARYADLSVDAERLIKWYGFDTRVGVFLHQEIATAFGVALPVHIEKLEGFYRLKLRPGAEKRLPPPPDFLTAAEVQEPGPAQAEEVPSPETEPLAPAEEEILDTFAQLDEWLALKGQFPDRNLFKDGIYALLQLYRMEPFEVKHPSSIAEGGSPLIFERGEKHAKLYLHHSADDKPYHKLVLRPDTNRRDLFSQVLAIGTGDYEVTEAERVEHAQLYDWLAGNMGELQVEMRQALAQSLRMPLETFVAFTKFLLLNITSDAYLLQPETLVRPVVGEPLSLAGLGDRARHLWENRDHIQALFLALFHYRDNLVDYPLLRQTVSHVDPISLLREVERINTSAVSTGFRTKVSKLELPFQNLVNLVKEYASYLCGRLRSQNYQLEPSQEVLRDVLRFCSPRGSVDAERLRKQLDDLQQMALSAKIRWQMQWNIRLQPVHRAPADLNFEQLHDDVKALLDAVEQMPRPMTIFGYLALQRGANEVTNRSEFEVLRTVETMQGPLHKDCIDRSLGKPQTTREFQEFREICQELQRVVEP